MSAALPQGALPGTPGGVPRLALTVAEAAEALGVSKRHFQRHLRDRLSWVYLGGLRVVAVVELERFLESNSVSAAGGRR